MLSMNKEAKSQQKPGGGEFQEDCMMATSLPTHMQGGDMDTAEQGPESLWAEIVGRVQAAFPRGWGCSKSELTPGASCSGSPWTWTRSAPYGH